MALLVKQGSFATGTTPGSHPVTGVGFQPKALILWCDARAAGSADGVTTNAATNSDMPTLFAIAAGTAIATLGNTDDFSGGDSGFDQTHLILAHSLIGTIIFQATLTSLDADGFTLSVSTLGANSLTVYYLALGGSDITGAKIVTGSLPTATGNKSYTGAGFKPSGVIMLGGPTAAAPQNWAGNSGIGMFTSTSQRVSASTGFQNFGVGSGTCVYERTDKAFVAVGGQVLDWEADLVTMDADGFTLNFTTVTAHVGVVAALCLAGPQMYVGADTKPTTPSSRATTGVGFRPSAFLTATVQAPHSASLNNALLGWGFGGTDGSGQAAITLSDGSSGTAYRSGSHTIGMASGSAATIIGESTITSLDADGFTLNWTTADATAREFIFMAFGPAGGAADPTLGEVQPIVRGQFA